MTPIRKALVIDDDDDMLRLCQVSLRTFTAWKVAVAKSADAAIRAAHAEAPDVILLDLMMPGPGGLSILSRLKGSETTAGIPVVLLTAADRSGIDECLAHGAAGLIAKPFEPAALADQIARIVAEAR